MLPYKLYVADKNVLDTKDLQWIKITESDTVMSLLLLAVDFIPLAQDDDIEYFIEAPDGEIVVTSLYLDEEFMKGGRVS